MTQKPQVQQHARESSTETDGVPSGSAGGSSRRRTRVSYRSEKKVRNLQFVLATVAIAAAIAAFCVVLYFKNISYDYEQLEFSYLKQQRELNGLKSELEKVRTERDQLVRGVRPNLRPMGFDEAIAIEERYLRNIIFTETRKDGHTSYEYRLVLHNNENTHVLPRLNIILFDEVGTQIALGRIGPAETPEQPTGDELAADEIRSYSGAIELFRNERPRYFLVTFR